MRFIVLVGEEIPYYWRINGSESEKGDKNYTNNLTAKRERNTRIEKRGVRSEKRWIAFREERRKTTLKERSCWRKTGRGGTAQ